LQNSNKYTRLTRIIILTKYPIICDSLNSLNYDVHLNYIHAFNILGWYCGKPFNSFLSNFTEVKICETYDWIKYYMLIKCIVDLTQ
jgi:hypothetical protein